MDYYNERLERILQRIEPKNCPTCGAPVIVENVLVGGNRHAMDDAVFPIVWIVCKSNKCGTHLKNVGATYFTQSPEDELKALEDALNIR